MMPLKQSEYFLEIVNSMVNVSLTQSYYNPTDQFLEVEYSFPINPNACVYRFVADFGSNRIQGIVKEKEVAKKEYQQAVKEGKKAAYGEVDAQSKDILNLKVGNIEPKQSVKIQIIYLQELTLSYNTFYQLHVPGTITPRYMHNMPAEVLKKGLRNPTAKAQGEFYWDFKISLRTTRKVVFFDSQSHDINMTSQNDSGTQTVLTMTDKCVPNKDFIFKYTTSDFELPSYVLGRTDISSTAMLSFIPKFCSLSLNDAYTASVQGTPF